ncbi:hypothetical protein HMPREF0373_01877 [Eubacterium ramulus ATCC 29099]|uniref:Uncharacterized protein n=1 Tax=Eubacterium ramulus ATCC 29099 TaxID=1256908 RepID=U2QY39_EUBRA|nr:hypothetical protein HMPREF0373_01877 [Eubacterium ramulus ATCC 29099]
MYARNLSKQIIPILHFIFLKNAVEIFLFYHRLTTIFNCTSRI